MNKDIQIQKLNRFRNELSSDQKANLDKDIRKIDWDVISRATRIAQTGLRAADEAFTPHPIHLRSEYVKKQAEYEATGLSMLNQNKLAAVVLAGGQGSRLGFEKPKGSYNIGIKAPLSIFECLVRNLEAVNRRLNGVRVPLCVMTSELNDSDTRRFFEDNGYFGYPSDKVFFFKQFEAPALDLNGDILLEEKDKVSYAPNGNGTWFSSMEKAGLIDILTDMGVEWLNVFAVDNVLQYIADPGFLGLCVEENSLCGAKVIAKANPEERVGALCLRNGKSSVVEYSEMTEAMRYQKDENGHYAYYYGVTLNYLFNIGHIQKVGDAHMPLHLAKKKIRALGKDGVSAVPDEPNAYKIETFIFDILETFSKVTALEIIREDEFAPVKNRDGADSPDTARALLKNKRPEWPEI